MKVSLMLPAHRVDRFDELASASAITELAQAAETAGFDAGFVTEHPFPGDRWLRSGGHHALDPFIALAYAAAATTTLRLHTNLFIPAYRNPFLAAKTIASLDVLSGGRVILGIGAGYMEAEFEALAVSFDERNDLTDEAIVAMRAAWTGESVVMAGSHFRVEGNTMLPRPAQPGGPPIWIGGNSKRAIRRAVELADGWSPMPNPSKSASRRHSPALETLDHLRERLAYAHEHATTVGRTAPLEVVFMPLGLDMFSNAPLDPPAAIASISDLAAAGVTYVVMSVPGDTRDDMLANIATFRDHIGPEITSL